jgi:hypothetical protein
LVKLEQASLGFHKRSLLKLYVLSLCCSLPCHCKAFTSYACENFMLLGF